MNNEKCVFATLIKIFIYPVYLVYNVWNATRRKLTHHIYIVFQCSMKSPKGWFFSVPLSNRHHLHQRAYQVDPLIVQPEAFIPFSQFFNLFEDHPVVDAEQGIHGQFIKREIILWAVVFPHHFQQG